MMSDAELQRHTRWQVHVGRHFDSELWADLPSDMTQVLEEALRRHHAQPIIFERYTQHQRTVFPLPPQTNRYTGMVRRTQRVVLLTVSM